MDIKDLFIIGKLGKVITEDNEFRFIANGSFQLAFVEKLAKVFLIFTEHRVFFVEIKDFCMRNSKYYISFSDEGVKDEVLKYNSCRIAVSEEEFFSNEYQEDLQDYKGFTAIDSDVTLGTVVDFMYNPKQRIMVLEDAQGKEILIPDVEYYVKEIDFEKKVVILQNSESLLDL